MKPDDLFALLQKLGIQHLRHRGRNITGACPVHNERRPSWGIRTDAPHIYGCFACDARGTLETLLQNVFHWSRGQIEAELGPLADLEFSGKFPSFEDKSLTLNSVPEEELYPFKFLGTPGQAYARKRRIWDVTSAKLGLLYHHHDNRLLFPWYVGETLVGATGRTLETSPDIPKIKAYFGLSKSESFYLPSRSFQFKQPLVLVEGEIDAIRVYQAGFTNVAALAQGSKVNSKQARRVVASHPSEVILFFDYDRIGNKITEDLLLLLQEERPWLPISKVYYPCLKLKGTKIDPGEMCEHKVRYVLRRRRPVSSWKSLTLD